MKNDLTDAEFAELDELLALTPEPLEPLDASMLDGYLCGVLVQPRLIESDEWLPHIFDYDGGELPDDVDAAWLDKVRALVLRRHAALNHALVEAGWFDPVVLDLDVEAPADVPAEADADQQAAAEAFAGMSVISRTLLPWVAGFQHAALCFPELGDLPDDAVTSALARLYRHLPADTEQEKEVVATLDREHPLKDLDDAIEEMVMTVAELFDLTQERRFHVEQVRRDTPKVGRNDPCPCGSGRKYKQCHGSN